MYLDEIGLVIQKTRKNRKITQEALASQLGMSRATISGIEKGTIPEIGIRKILSICDALGLELLAQTKTKRPTLQQLMKREENDA
jgi:transcriptional regulator with XRE-family HTH domain